MEKQELLYQIECLRPKVTYWKVVLGVYIYNKSVLGYYYDNNTKEYILYLTNAIGDRIKVPFKKETEALEKILCLMKQKAKK